MPRAFGNTLPSNGGEEKKNNDNELLDKYREILKNFNENTPLSFAADFERFSKEAGTSNIKKETHRLACKLYRKAKACKSVENQVVFRSAASHAMENCAVRLSLSLIFSLFCVPSRVLYTYSPGK